MKFLEIVEGFSIRIDSIVSVKELEETVVIETENRAYQVSVPFGVLMLNLENELRGKSDGGNAEEDAANFAKRFNTQFFGG